MHYSSRVRCIARTLLATVSVALPTVVVAADGESAVSAADLARYDVNRDGRLDPTERAAMNVSRDTAAAPARSSSAATGEGEVLQLSPFTVNASEDRGYYAANTLSGTRLNSKLEDLGASITVVTKQQMQDFALLDVNDIFLYEAGTEGTGNYTDVTIDRSGAVIDNVQSSPNTANRVRGIAPANLARGNYATTGTVPLDPIDMDAVEISRGPNSSIFGLGNASGTVNIIPAAAQLGREFTKLEGRIDDVGSTRVALDLNRPLTDTVAIRASAVYQDDEFHRKPSGAYSKRYNGMITWKPFKRHKGTSRYTTLKGSAQYYEGFFRRPNYIVPRDGMSHWVASGSPVWNAATATVTLNGTSRVVAYNGNQGRETTALGPGLQSPGSGLYARSNLFVDHDGTIGAWSVGSQNRANAAGQPDPTTWGGNARFVEAGQRPSGGPLFTTNFLPITDKGVYDWTSLNIVAPNWNQSRSRNFTGELEHFFLFTPRHVLGLQLGYNREETSGFSRNFIGQGGSSPLVVYVDVNSTLLDGSPNPFFRRPYLNAQEPTAYRSKYERDTFRGQLAYQVKLSREQNWLRWFGDHSFLAYGEYKDGVNAPYSYRDAIVSDHAWLPAGANRANGAAVARGYYRYYVGDANGFNVDYSPPDWMSAQGTFDLQYYNPTTRQWVKEAATIGQAYFQAGRTFRSRNVIKTYGGVIQSHLFNDRIVPTFGIRRDTNLNRDSAGTTLQPDGITENQETNRSWPNDWLRRKGKTETKGVVVKPLRGWAWMNRAAESGGVFGFLADAARSTTFFYNKSNSFLPQTIAQNLAGELLPDATGLGENYGFSFGLFDNKLILRYNQYENVQQDTRFGDSGIVATRAARLDFSALTGGSDRFNLYRNALGWFRSDHPDWTPDQIEDAVAEFMGFPRDQLARMNRYPIADTSNVTAKGKEIEISFNPNRYFRSKVTVAQTKSINDRVSPGIQAYFDQRMPLWTTLPDLSTREPGPDGRLHTADDQFDLWWTTRYGSSGTPQQFFDGAVNAPYRLATAMQGKSRSQVREWRANAFGALQLGVFGDNKWLKRTSINAAVRWEDKGSIGYYTLANDPTGYDPDRPIYDDTHTYVDAGISYTQKIYRNKVDMRVQLNVRNLTESGRLQPTAALPDGVPFVYRIVDPRLFILTVSFDL